MKLKYIGTIAGLALATPGLLTTIRIEMMIFMSVPIISFIPIAVPLEVLGNSFFDNYASIALFVLFGLTTLFVLSSYFYFKSLINGKKQNRKFNHLRFWGYLGLQFIILHPLVFYIWAFNNSESSGDGQFIFGTFETFPISSGLFLLLGITIDYFKKLKITEKKLRTLIVKTVQK